jgi:integrase
MSFFLGKIEEFPENGTNLALSQIRSYMGTITKRVGKTGTSYKVQVRHKGFPPQTETFSTKEKAKKWMNSVESAMEDGRFVNTKEASTTTLEQALTRYATDVIPSKAYPEKEMSFIRHWLAQEVAKKALANCRSSDFSLLRDLWLKQGDKPSSVARRLAVISHVFTVARKDWNYEGLSNPLSDVTKPKVDNARERTVKDRAACEDEYAEEPEEPEEPEDDVEDPTDRANIMGEIDLLAVHTDSKMLPRAIDFALETAMRRSELASLRWVNVQMRTKVARLPKTKNGTARDVPLSPRALEILRNQRSEMSDGDRVFPVTPDAITRAFRRALKRAREVYVQECIAASRPPDETFLVGLRFHDLRHEATTRLAKIFAMHELAKITGHKSSKMLLRYYHPKASDLAKRFEELAA